MISNMFWLNYWIAIVVSIILGILISILVKELYKEGGNAMKISKFSELVAKSEGKKKQINIAQIKEILKVVNDLLDGELYKLIRKQ